MEKTKYKLSVKYILAILAALVCTFAVRMNAFAETSYEPTWASYKENVKETKTWNDVVDAMDILIDASKEMFEAGDLDGAWKGINDAYYGYYETTGFERVAMGYISGSRKTEMELQFSSAKSVAKKNGSYEDFAAQADKLSDMLREDANKLDGVSSDSGSSDTTTSSTSTSAATATFIACFSIMLREGFEAILIVGAIIAYLQKSAGSDRTKKRKAAVPVYVGSVVGIVASFILAWLLDAIKLANSASQEIIEGVTALTAVAVLYYVSNWMLSKSETDAWTAYIKSKAQRSSEKGSVFALAFTAFLAVFREGAEVVLFFQPMLSEDNISSVWMGFAIGCICLVFVYLAIHLLSVRIPIKPFFTATSVLMFVMSISFLGAGIKELIEGNVITPTYPDWLSWIPTNDFLDVLGIYGCLETLIPQLILLVITVVIFVVQTKKNRAIHAKAEAERAAAEKIRIEREKKAEDIGFRKRVAEIYKELSDKGADAVLLALAEEEKALSAEAAADKAE